MSSNITFSQGVYQLGVIKAALFLNEFRKSMDSIEKILLDEAEDLSKDFVKLNKNEPVFLGTMREIKVNALRRDLSGLLGEKQAKKIMRQVENGEFKNGPSFAFLRHIRNTFTSNGLTIEFGDYDVKWNVKPGESAHENAMSSLLGNTFINFIKKQDLNKEGRGGFILMKGDNLMPDLGKDYIIINQVGAIGEDFTEKAEKARQGIDPFA